MTPIIWLFCLAVLWTIVVDAQAQEVQPLVMAVHVQEHIRKGEILNPAKKAQTRRMIFTDAEKENVDNFKLVCDKTQPTHIALLCGDTKKDSEKHNFIVKQIVDKIDSIDQHLTCEYLPQPYAMVMTNFYFKPNFYDIGFQFRMTADRLLQIFELTNEKEAVESFELWYRFKNEFDIELDLLETRKVFVKYFTIRYNFVSNVPASVTHTVMAHMHSNEYEKICEKIYIPDEKVLEEKRSPDLIAAQFQPEQTPPDHQWRQLIPIQDFKDIYQTQATCFYLNYVLLNEKAISSLENIEIFIRQVADVINEVSVHTGTYIEKSNNSDSETENEVNSIPTIVWKKISYFGNNKWYQILAVIHNKETKRVCNDNNAWGWPENNENQEEIGIGAMYYCLRKESLSKEFEYLEYSTDYLPFNLYEVPYQRSKINVIEKIKNKFSLANTEKGFGNRIKKWLSWMKWSFR